MSKSSDYFKNHQNAKRFPWSLYHSPLENSLLAFLKKQNTPVRKKLLVIGPGAFFELNEIKSLNYDVDILDIDKRVLDLFDEEKKEGLIKNIIWDEEGMLKNIPSNTYDVVYAKEVIEHVLNENKYVQNIHKILKPDGQVWMSTPNYGSTLMPFLEITILELIARYNGFSRKHIHPTKFDMNRLKKTFDNNQFKIDELKETDFRFALVVSAKKI